MKLKCRVTTVLNLFFLVFHYSKATEEFPSDLSTTNLTIHNPPKETIVHEQVVEVSTRLPFFAMDRVQHIPPTIVSLSNSTEELNSTTLLPSLPLSLSSDLDRASVPLKVLDTPVTLPATSDIPVVSPLPVLTSDQPSNVPVIPDSASPVPVTDEGLPTRSEEQEHPELPVLAVSTERPTFENHDITIEEILKQSPSVDEGPIILRPNEIAQVNPVYIPVQRSVVTCPHCGGRQNWQRTESCSKCPFCGRSTVPQSRQPGQSTQNAPRDLRKSNSLPNRSPFGVYKAQPIEYVPIEADVSLNRRELLRRRLNHQRVSQYMKSISPEKSPRDNNNPTVREVELPESTPYSPVTENSSGQESYGPSFASPFSWFNLGWGAPKTPRHINCPVGSHC